MRIIVTGDRNWYDPDLAEQVINRLILRYGPSLVIVHGAATGIDRWQLVDDAVLKKLLS